MIFLIIETFKSDAIKRFLILLINEFPRPRLGLDQTDSFSRLIQFNRDPIKRRALYIMLLLRVRWKLIRRIRQVFNWRCSGVRMKWRHRISPVDIYNNASWVSTFHLAMHSPHSIASCAVLILLTTNKLSSLQGRMHCNVEKAWLSVNSNQLT
jgi:hypothetical protein